MQSKNAALFAIGLLSANFWPHDSARCQTSLAPPLSLARPAPSPDDSAPPPAIIRASPPTAPEDDPPPATTAKRRAPPVTARDKPSPAANNRAAPPVATNDLPSPKPAADYDGFSIGVQEEPAPKAPAKPRAATRSKSTREPDSGAKQPSLDYGDDDQLKRKLTICRDCK